jgi:glycerol-3-phosphate dehydrogenase (NAD(P)+)
MPKVAIVGTTAWGITLGVVLARKNLDVRLLARTQEEASGLQSAGYRSGTISGVLFPDKLSISHSLPDVFSGASAAILAVPSQSVRRNLKQIASYLNGSMLIVNAAKGIELETNKRMSEVITEELPADCHPNICVLSGPNLSQEILDDLPGAAVIAARDEAVARKARRLLNTPNLCLYTNTDIVGVELGGALKNIIALGAGIADGLGYGDNAKAALITRGLTEMTALGVAMGANPLTFSGLTGLGDLVATCASPLSRNHYVGVELTKGRPLEEIVKSMSGIAEGLSTTIAAHNLAQKLGVEMPVCEKIYMVLYKGHDPGRAALELMEATARHELAGRKWKLFSLFKR